MPIGKRGAIINGFGGGRNGGAKNGGRAIGKRGGPEEKDQCEKCQTSKNLRGPKISAGLAAPESFR